MTKRVAVLVCIVLTLSLALVFIPSSGGRQRGEPYLREQALCFSGDGEYTVLHLTDLHELIPISAMHSKDNRRTGLDPENSDFFNSVIDLVKPDLVVLGGDNIFPLSTLGEIVKQETLKTISALCALFDAKQQYWTMIFGNHDDECIFDKTAQLTHAAQNSAYFIGGFTDGEDFYSFTDNKNDMVANFALPLYDVTHTHILYNLFTFDSGSARAEGESSLGGYNYIRQTQIDWYIRTSAAITADNDGLQPPAIAFTHIPLYEHEEAYINKDTSSVLRWTGEYGGYALSRVHSGIYDAFCQVGDVKAVFTGHNHSHSFTAVACKPDGGTILLSTTRQCSKWDGYSTDDYNPPYARVITLYADGGLSTAEVKTELFNAISI